MHIRLTGVCEWMVCVCASCDGPRWGLRCSEERIDSPKLTWKPVYDRLLLSLWQKTNAVESKGEWAEWCYMWTTMVKIYTDALCMNIVQLELHTLQHTTSNLVNKTVPEFLEGGKETRWLVLVHACVCVCRGGEWGGWWISRPTSSSEAIRPDVCQAHSSTHTPPPSLSQTHTHPHNTSACY